MKKDQRGFTLIEVTVYLGLFAILIGGAVITAYNVIESSGRNQTRAILQEEGDFLTAKINYVLSGAQSVSSPSAPPSCASPTQSSNLSVLKYDGSSYVVSLDASEQMLLQKGADIFILNNANVKVKDLIFTHSLCSSGEGVKAGFTLNANTPNGFLMSQDFFTTVYLRK